MDIDDFELYADDDEDDDFEEEEFPESEDDFYDDFASLYDDPSLGILFDQE